MTGRYIRGLFTVLTLLALASPSFAARRSSLSGNLLIQDQDDIFFFPHLVTAQKRMVTFDFGSSDGIGSGGMVFGSEQITLGAFTHRSDFLGALSDAFFTRGDIDHVGTGVGSFPTPGGNSVGIGVGPDALNWIDAIIGWQMGETPWGVRFSLGRGNVDPAPDTIDESVTAFNAIVGTRLNRWNADVSVEFTYASATDNAAAGKTESSPFHVGVGVRRTAGEESDALVLGWLGTFGYTSGSLDFTPTGGTQSSTDRSSMDLVIGAGPVYKPNDRTNVAMYGTFEYSQQKDESPALTETWTSMVIPGWNIAAEVDLASWLQWRAGMQSKFRFFNNKNEPTPGTATEDKSNILNFGWTTGLGMKVGQLQIDGMLNPTVLTSGTDLLGNDSELFGLVSGTFRF